MAGTRRNVPKGLDINALSRARPRRSVRRGNLAAHDPAVPDVYQEMLASGATSSQAAGHDEDSRPLKKRKTLASRHPEGPDPMGLPSRDLRSQPVIRRSPTPRAPSSNVSDDSPGHGLLQTIEASDDSDDSDLEWEDALGDGVGDSEGEDLEDTPIELRDIDITIGGKGVVSSENRRKARRRGMTSVEKNKRVDIHKMHILCLLCHIHRRNAWCNDHKVQAALRKLPSAELLSNLVPNPELTQYQSSKRFLTGMQALSALWQKRFSVTALGMHKPRWADTESDVQEFTAFDDYDEPMDKQDFRKAAMTLRGSQDIGAQLFCAMLRSIGVDARLVCSLQCLPFASLAQPSTPLKQPAEPKAIHMDPFNDEQVTPRSKPTTPSRPKRRSRLERVLGERHPALSPSVRPNPKPKTLVLSYPVYWVEAFNTAHQKWIPIDPHSTCTTDKPEKLEPPLNYSQNSLAYVLAFEEDYTAKDVTRRYAKAYNAKTRKLRLESIEGGTKWLKKALKPFRRTVPLDRDQVEDAALARKEAAEGIPKNVQDFKNHPIYVLERHLRHNEVIHPMHQVGKVNVGSSLNPKMEPIYRRKDVHIVRSADKWYRLGRDVKDGEQPLKHAKPKRGGARSLPPDAEGDEQTEEVGAGLYAVFQTELYVPPPVVHGRVPRNAFGNLDLYVPSMVPPGGAHIRHKLAAKAARILGVDSVDAVTGFSFKGRHGTAVIQGVVVAEEYQEAVEAVIDAMEYAQEEAENKQRSDEALRTWRRFLLGLRIAQRVNAIEIDGETGPVVDFQEEIGKEDRQIIEDQLAGGFFMDDRAAAEPMPRVSNRVYQDKAGGGGFVPGNHEAGGGFIPDDAEQSGGSIPEQAEQAGGFIPNDDDRAGGFIPGDDDDDDDEEAGGFIPEPESAPKAPYTPPKVPSLGPSSSHPVAAPAPRNDGSADDTGGGSVPENGGGDLPMQDAPDAASGDPVAAVEGSDTGLTQDIRNVAVAEKAHGVDVSSEVARDGRNASPLQQGELGPQPEEKGAPEPQRQREPEPEPPNSSPSDAGSLPLEDPEDEDADPDWLVDAT